MKLLKVLLLGVIIVSMQAYAQKVETHLSETAKGSLEGITFSRCGLRVGAMIAAFLKSDNPERNAARLKHMISYNMFGPFGSFGAVLVDECKKQKSNVTK